MSAPLERARHALARPVQAVWSALASRRAVGEAPRRVLFAAPRHGGGTTTLGACTAMELCRNLRARVALVEANPFTPALAAYARCDADPGFAEVLRGRAPAGEVLRPALEPGLVVLPGGNLGADEPVDWRGPGVRELLGEHARDFAFVLLDGPPLLDRPAGRLLLDFADAVVLVARAGTTTKRDLRAARQVVEDAGVPVAGVVLNRFRKPLPFL